MMKFDKKQLLVYGITKTDTTFEMVEAALQGGATCIQLREKNMEHAMFVEKIQKMTKLCHAYHVPLIVDDDVDAALEGQADGVHVGIEDESVASIRKRVPENFIVGATAKTIEQAQIAKAQGADYLGVGAIFPSPTKKNAIRITKEQLIEIRKSMDLPIVAIGGITYENMDILQGVDVQGIAVVSALFGGNDTKARAEKLVEKVKEIL